MDEQKTPDSPKPVLAAGWHLLRYRPDGKALLKKLMTAAKDIASRPLWKLYYDYKRVEEFLRVPLGPLAPYQDETGIRFYRNTSAEYQATILAEYNKIPQPIRDYLKAQSVKIAFARVMSEIFYRDEKTYFTPHIDDSCVHDNQVPAIYVRKDDQLSVGYTRERYVALAEFYKTTRPKVFERPPKDMGFFKDEWLRTFQDDLKGALYHEIGHAFDHVSGEVSGSAWFEAAYRQDVQRLGGPEAARAAGLGYYIQDQRGDQQDKEGVAEVFAESWARHFGAVTDELLKDTDFPACAKAVAQFQQGFDKAYAQGSKQLSAYLKFVRSTDAVGRDVSVFDGRRRPATPSRSEPRASLG